jgi:hypothetical protein
MPERDAMIRTIKEFPWWDFGLDEVAEADSDEWARALADAILDTPTAPAAPVDGTEARAWGMLLGAAESVLEDAICEDEDDDPDEHDAARDRAMELVDQLRDEKGVTR